MHIPCDWVGDAEANHLFDLRGAQHQDMAQEVARNKRKTTDAEDDNRKPSSSTVLTPVHLYKFLWPHSQLLVNHKGVYVAYKREQSGAGHQPQNVVRIG